jgi:pimeloyl-ACP methyl ester carboxylesterase
MMHGFPDDSRIYNRLVPKLRPRRVVTFDWLGYGRSDRSEVTSLDGAGHQVELKAVLDDRDLEGVVLVAHDASGPDAIDFAVDNPGRVSHLILLNTYYGHAPSLRLPEMIRLFADENLAPLADAMVDDANQRLWLLQHTARRFGADPFDPDGIGMAAVLPQFFGDGDDPDALPAVRAWTRNLFPSLDQQDARVVEGRLSSLDVPVTLIFGADDKFLGRSLAADLARLFRTAQIRLVQDAVHWPQWDQPETVAQLIDEALGH